MAEEQSLEDAVDELWDRASDHGLEPFPVVFEEVPSGRLYDIAAYGMPSHYRHWSYGKRYHMMKKKYDEGRGRIMELVVNANPALAYLLKNNHDVYNKMVCAHVFGHSDFFRHNMYFEPTNRHKVTIFQAHQQRIAEYEEEHGVEAVESILDAAHSLRQQRPITPLMAKKQFQSLVDAEQDLDTEESESERPLFEEYRELFPERAADDNGEENENNEDFPRKDLLLFLIEESEALEDWERDILCIVHDEQTFFLPQMVTKTMNEGWATFWHTRLMKELELTEQEHLLYAQSQGRLTARNPMDLNPYLIGWKIYEDILERDGLERCFEVRVKHSDASFYREFLTDELIEELDLYTIEWEFQKNEPEKATVKTKNPETVRQRMANLATHHNIPSVEVEGIAPDNTLNLQYTEQRDLIEKDARRVLGFIKKLWGGEVRLKQRESSTLHPLTGDETNE